MIPTRSLFLIACLVSESLLAAPSLRVSPGQWSVQMIAAPHIGDPLLRVDISREFPWPAPRDGVPIRYQVLLQPPGQRAAQAGWITADERFLVISSSAAAADDLTATPEQDARRRAAREATREALLKSLGSEGSPVPRNAATLAAALVRRYAAGVEWRVNERWAFMRYAVYLRPFAGDRALARQEGPKRATPSKYKWGQVVDDAKDGCNGKKPDECAREKLVKFKDRVCDAKNADQSPRFAKECEELKRMLAKPTPEPRIECDIPSDKGVTAGVTDTDGTITLNGDALLTDPCPETIVFHELKHSLELQDPALYPNLKKLRDAEKRGQKAQEDLNAPGASEAQKANARDRLARAMIDIMAVEKQGGTELLQTECNALFAILDNGDFFNYPGEGLPCVKAGIKNMIGELAGIRKMFALPLKDPAGPLCKCFTKMNEYVLAHADVKANLEKDVFAPGKSGRSTAEMLDTLTATYCMPP